MYIPGMIANELDETMCPQNPLCMWNWHDLLPDFKEIESNEIEEPDNWEDVLDWLKESVIVVCPSSYDPTDEDSGEHSAQV